MSQACLKWQGEVRLYYQVNLELSRSSHPDKPQFLALVDDFGPHKRSYRSLGGQIITVYDWYAACSCSLMLWLPRVLTTTQTSTATGAGRKKPGFASASMQSKRASRNNAASPFLLPRSLCCLLRRTVRKKIRSRSIERRKSRRFRRFRHSAFKQLREISFPVFSPHRAVDCSPTIYF